MYYECHFFFLSILPSPTHSGYLIVIALFCSCILFMDSQGVYKLPTDVNWKEESLKSDKTGSKHDVISATRQQFKGHLLCADPLSFKIEVYLKPNRTNCIRKTQCFFFPLLNKLTVQEFVLLICQLCAYFYS